MSKKRLVLLATLAVVSATTVSNARLTTCTVPGGDTSATTPRHVHGHGDEHRRTPRRDVHDSHGELLDTTSGLGRVVGVFRIQGANGAGAHGSINAAVANGDANGSLVASVRNPGGRLFATLSSPFDPSGGFGVSPAGSVGTGTPAATGVVVSGVACHQWHRYPLRWLHRHLRHHYN